MFSVYYTKSVHPVPAEELGVRVRGGGRGGGALVTAVDMVFRDVFF